MKRPHVGFPEKTLDKYLSLLVNHGYKVAVVEQTESVKGNPKFSKTVPLKDQQVMNREIVFTSTKGTFVDKDSYEPRHVLAIKSEGGQLGVCFFDLATLKFWIG